MSILVSLINRLHFSKVLVHIWQIRILFWNKLPLPFWSREGQHYCLLCHQPLPADENYLLLSGPNIFPDFCSSFSGYLPIHRYMLPFTFYRDKTCAGKWIMRSSVRPICVEVHFLPVPLQIICFLKSPFLVHAYLSTTLYRVIGGLAISTCWHLETCARSVISKQSSLG